VLPEDTRTVAQARLHILLAGRRGGSRSGRDIGRQSTYRGSGRAGRTRRVPGSLDPRSWPEAGGRGRPTAASDACSTRQHLQSVGHGSRRPGSPGGAQQVTGWGLRASEIAPEDLVSHVDAHLAPQAHGVGHTLLRRVNVDLLAGTQAEPLAYPRRRCRRRRRGRGRVGSR
jgi:hypothetical protein